MPTGLLSDRWGRKKILLLGATLKAVSFSLLPLWTGYAGFLCYNLTMGIALSLISGGDVALLYESHLAAGGRTGPATSVLGNVKLAGQSGAAASALVGGAVVILSFAHLLWINALLAWIPVLLVLAIAEPPAPAAPVKPPPVPVRQILATVLTRNATTRLVFLNMVAWGIAGLVMVWTNQKYWQDSQVPLAWFGALYAAYSLTAGFGSRLAGLAAARFGPRAPLAAVAVASILVYFGMAAFPGWPGIALGLLAQLGYGLGQVLFLNALNERIPSAIRATIISMASLSVRAAFSLLGPLVGFGIDSTGLPAVLAAIGVVYTVTLATLLRPLLARLPPQGTPPP
jgi:MFS family permease